jgi:hypothetical protein
LTAQAFAVLSLVLEMSFSKRLSHLDGTFSPPHHQTNSYHSKCLVFPVVEGRLFMRGFDGIYCYDLRKKD